MPGWFRKIAHKLVAQARGAECDNLQQHACPRCGYHCGVQASQDPAAGAVSFTTDSTGSIEGNESEPPALQAVIERLEKRNQQLKERNEKLKEMLRGRDEAARKLLEARTTLRESLLRSRRNTKRYYENLLALRKRNDHLKSLYSDLKNRFDERKVLIKLSRTRERNLAQQIETMRSDVTQKSKSISQYKNEIATHKTAVHKLESLLMQQLVQNLDETYDLLLVCQNYPNKVDLYGRGFIRSRVQAYRSCGLSILVCDASVRNEVPQLIFIDAIAVLQMPHRLLPHCLFCLGLRFRHCAVHAPYGTTVEIILNTFPRHMVSVWLHGSEVRDYRRFIHNYSSEELEEKRTQLDARNALLQRIAQLYMPSEEIKKVFVSQSLLETTAEDTGTAIKGHVVIPNYIDDNFFTYEEKEPAAVNNILMIRSFRYRHYGTDIAIEAILVLSGFDAFKNMRFTIRGCGKLFAEQAQQVAHLATVDIAQEVLTAHQIQELHASHGIFLAPSRMDSQGVSACEAMASGLVPVTTPIGGIPEFIDETCGILVRPDDPYALAQGILQLHTDPDLFARLSRNAAARVRRQCGFAQTIGRELELLGFSPAGAEHECHDTDPAL